MTSNTRPQINTKNKFLPNLCSIGQLLQKSLKQTKLISNAIIRLNLTFFYRIARSGFPKITPLVDNKSKTSNTSERASNTMEVSLISQQNLKIFSLHFRSIKNKLKIFKTYLTTEKIDIFLGCETFLDNTITDFMISSEFSIYRTDKSIHSGGTKIGIKNNLKNIKLNFETKTFQSTFAQLLLKYKKYY